MSLPSDDLDLREHLDWVGLFVKHPPSTEAVTSADVADNDLLLCGLGPDVPDWMPITIKAQQFKSGRNPLVGLELVILCQEAGIYPPVEVMQWLADAFRKWHKNNGEFPLERMMGLKTQGKTGNAIKEGIQEQLEHDLMRELWQLKEAFGVTNGEAAVMIAERLELGEWNNTGMKLRTYNERTLQKMYESEWARIFRDHELNWTEAEKIEALSHYPRHSYEHLEKLNRYL